MRVLVFLIVSGALHFAAARWLFAVCPAARRRRGLVRGIAIVLSVSLAALRVLAWLVDAAPIRWLMAFAMTEVVAVGLSLLPIGIVMLASRVGGRLAARLRPVRSSPRGMSGGDDRTELVSSTEDRDDHDPTSDAKGVGLASSPAAAVVGRREAIERTLGVGIFGATSLALGWGMVRGRHAFALEEVVVKIDGWPRVLDGYTIAQISDIHVGPFVDERELAEGLSLVRSIKPDLVVATGDLVDSESFRADLLGRRLSELAARDGVHAILGNHDHYAGAADVVRRLSAANVNVLVNRGLRLRKGDGGGFALLGVDDLKGRDGSSSGFDGPDLAGAIASVPGEGLPRILLAHQPNYFREAMGHVALQLSGHTHGGQINPGWRPADAVMRYVAGRYDDRGSTLWVNRGFGVAGPPSRVGAPPEVTKIVLVGA